MSAEKVFISSVIRGLEAERDVADSAIRSLDLEPVRAERFGANSATPQQACLAGVRECKRAVLILGSRYGHKQASGKSATHEEYLEARERGEVLVFVQVGVTPDADQANFIEVVGAWNSGQFIRLAHLTTLTAR